MILATGLRLVSGIVDIHPPLGITSNYSATTNLHNSPITTTPVKPFLTVDVLQLHALKSSLHRLPNRTE
jgi:hypothetical protein